MACAFLDSFFYIALMSFSLYTYNRDVKITFCPLHNPLDFGHHNESFVSSETSPSVYFYGFTAISLIVFFLFFLIDAIAGENTMQLIVSMLTSVLVTYYTLFKSFRFTGLNYAWYCWCVPLAIVKVIFELIYFVLVYFVWDSFGHIAFSIVGAKKEQNDQFGAYLRLTSALWLDLVLSLFYGAMIGFLSDVTTDD